MCHVQDTAHPLAQAATLIVHEFRNPLSAIKMGLSTLSVRTGLVDTDRRIVSLALKEVDRLEHLLRDLHAAFALDPPYQIETPLYPVIGEVLSSLSPRFEEKHVRLAEECDPSLPPIRIDPGQFHLLLTHLLVNALDASNPGNRVIVRSWGSPSEARLWVEVEDEGMGLAPGLLDKAFEPFVTTKKGALGLGLTIARRIAEAHEGLLSLCSLEKGTKAVLSLPLGGKA